MKPMTTKEAAWHIHRALSKPRAIYSAPHVGRRALATALRVLEIRLADNRRRKLRR